VGSLISIILLTLGSGFLSLIGSLIISTGNKWSESLMLKLVSFAAGVLLSTSILDILPEAIEVSIKPDDIVMPLFIGILFMFFMERFILVFHHHHFDVHELKPSAYLILVGDSIHNFLDGIAIAAAFLTSIPVGFVTSIAVASHEVPQEISDYTICVTNGLKPKTALLLNSISSLFSVLGGVLAFFFFSYISIFTNLILAFTAGSFLYIACADIIPELHKSSTKKNILVQTTTFLFGVALTVFVKNLI